MLLKGIYINSEILGDKSLKPAEKFFLGLIHSMKDGFYMSNETAGKIIGLTEKTIANKKSELLKEKKIVKINRKFYLNPEFFTFLKEGKETKKAPQPQNPISEGEQKGFSNINYSLRRERKSLTGEHILVNDFISLNLNLQLKHEINLEEMCVYIIKDIGVAKHTLEKNYFLNIHPEAFVKAYKLYKTSRLAYLQNATHENSSEKKYEENKIPGYFVRSLRDFDKLIRKDEAARQEFEEKRKKALEEEEERKRKFAKEKALEDEKRAQWESSSTNQRFLVLIKKYDIEDLKRLQLEVALKSGELDIAMLEKQLEMEEQKRMNILKKNQIISQFVSRMMLAGYDTDKLSKERDRLVNLEYDEIVNYVSRVA